MTAVEHLTPDADAGDGFEEFYDLLWGHYDLGDDLVSVDRVKAGGGFGKPIRVRADDPAALQAAIDRAEAMPDTGAVYVRQTTLPADFRPERPTSRGGARDSAQLAWLWADVDTRDGVHAANDDPTKLPLPTVDEALDLVNGAPWGPPTLIIHSGGGLYPIWGLIEPVDAQSSETLDLLGGVERWLQQTFRHAGRYIDPNVADDLTRILRPVGSLNRKRKRGHVPVTLLEHDGSRRYDPEHIMQYTPEAPEDTAFGTVGTGKPSGDRPGDRFSATPGALERLLEKAGLRFRGNRATYPRPDGTYSRTDSHATVVVGTDGIPCVIAAHGTRM